MTTAVSDTFTASDGTALNGRSPDVGGAWTADPELTIQSNRLRSSTSFKSGGLSAGLSDGYIEIEVGDFSTSGATRHLAIFRMAGSGGVPNHMDHWQAFVYRTADGGFRRVGLTKRVSWTFTEMLAVDPGAIAAAGPHVLRAEYIGDRIKVFWNGAQQGATLTDSTHQSNTYVGVGFDDGGGGYIDNLLVETLDGEPVNTLLLGGL